MQKPTFFDFLLLWTCHTLLPAAAPAVVVAPALFPLGRAVPARVVGALWAPKPVVCSALAAQYAVEVLSYALPVLSGFVLCSLLQTLCIPLLCLLLQNLPHIVIFIDPRLVKQCLVGDLLLAKSLHLVPYWHNVFSLEYLFLILKNTFYGKNPFRGENSTFFC